MDSRAQLKEAISKINYDNLINFFRAAHDGFAPSDEDYSSYLDSNENLIDIKKIGNIEFNEAQRLIITSIRINKELTSRSGKKRQYDLGKKILKQEWCDAGIFIFHDDKGNFRFSLIVAQYFGTKRTFSNFRRYTYYVSPQLPNKTFLNQIGRANFSSIEKILSAFSIEAVSNDFYNEFKPNFDKIAEAVQKTDDVALKQDFALLFVIRIIFLGFVQRKGWLGKDNFILDLWKEYASQYEGQDKFYTRWLEPLFFEALNSPPGRKVKYRNNDFSKETDDLLQQAPYLNGELFKEKRDVDDQGLWIPDALIYEFLKFLFQYNFTIEENTLYDEELELNPEFLGIIFERLVRKADGAVYTPRTEVDFMCRMALVKWLEKNSNCEQRDLYHLLFRERGKDAEYDELQKYGDFSTSEIRELIQLLENVTVCDPAAGSGAFEVGMLHVLEEVFENLCRHPNFPADIKKKTAYERKKDIIANSLYGVEVKHWAVWINQLRLWLTLFIDMPDEERHSPAPLLPSLDFKVRCGDSLVQRIGSKMFPVQGHADLPGAIKTKITELKKLKVDFFHNRGKNNVFIRQRETQIFREILDIEIAEKRRELRGLNALREKQTDLGFSGKSSLADEPQKQLETEIAELEDQKQSLKDKHPLIWNIEFAEIFFERGGFDIIIGNPPYVRQENISDPNQQLPPKEYKAALQQMVRMDFPDHFKPTVKIDGKSDLYTYFYVRSLHLLNLTGIHVFICSNSWLDVGYGAWLQYFLLRNVPLCFIVDNHAKRSFAASDVNTIITIFSAPAKQKQNQSAVKFVAFKQPFENVIFTENLLEIEQAHVTDTNGRYRVYPAFIESLMKEGSEFETEQQEKLSAGNYIGDKWGGKYLRAPDIFFTILEKGKDKFVKLKDVAEVRFGIKTGANDFFYLIPLGSGSRPNSLRVRNGAGWEGEIEDQFLRPVIKSPRECPSILIEPEELKFRIFMCNKEKEALKGTNALKYIEWGERAEIAVKQGKNKGTRIKGYNNLESVKNRRLWWSLPKIVGNTFWGKELRERLASFVSEKPIMADCRLYCAVTPIELRLFCNSTIYHLLGEARKRDLGGGGGPRSLMVYEVSDSLVLAKVQFNNTINLDSRDLRSVFEECGIDPKSDIPISQQEPRPLPDRAELDKIVFDALNLTEEERKEVYRAVCQLVWNRISKARSV